ncbi:MAG: response regulator transcription factor [Niastella sp.]|nr:response regulator transcription factor [Niastella sp.]
MAKILIIDDHSIIRVGIAFLIRQEIPSAVIDEAKSGDAAVALLKKNTYELVILDVNIPGTDTIDFISYLLTATPHLNILIFTMNPEEWYGRRFLKMGVKGFLNKESPEEEIKKAIWTVLKGNRYISPALAQIISMDALEKKKDNPFDELSNREFDVAMRLTRGDSVSVIAESLNLHASTVGTHKAHIFEKLNVQNIIQLADLARLYDANGISGNKS